jgi:hypothetical protein
MSLCSLHLLKGYLRRLVEEFTHTNLSGIGESITILFMSPPAFFSSSDEYQLWL